MRGTFTQILLLSFVFANSQTAQITANPTTATQTTTGTTFTSNTTLIGGIQASDNTRITATNIPGNQALTTTLILGGFNFSTIPIAANILDIDVIIEGSSTNNRANAAVVQLTSNGVLIGENGASTNTNVFNGGGNANNNPDVLLTYGGTDYTFGLTGPQLVGAFFTNNNIGVQLQFKNVNPNAGNATTLLLDNVRIVVTYEVSEIPPPLPVEFISFDAQQADNGVQLSWKVGTEVNVNHYDVERSTDGVHFKKIGSVNAAQSSNYNYTDLQPVNGVAYYRVRNVDHDGTFKYSTVAKFKNGLSTALFKAFPTTTRGQVTLQHPAAANKTLIIISNLDGRTLRSLAPVNGSVSTPIDLSAYPSGTYLLQYQGEQGQTQTFRIIKH